MNEAKKGKKKKKIKINKILSVLLILTTVIFYGVIFYINIIPIFYVLVFLLIELAIIAGLILLNFSRKKGCRLIGYFFSFIIICISIFVQIYLFNTLGFLFNATDGNYALKTYNVLVLKDSNFKKIKDLENCIIGISETSFNDSLNEAKDKLNKKVKLEYENSEDIRALIESILNREIDAIILENSEIDLLKEQDYQKYDTLNVIEQIEIRNNIEALKDAVNINKETFNVYISGIDTFGSINSSSRSDVNIVLTINPKEEKILITWIPRDYYVHINNSNYKDKLTHAGIYGIDSSIYAIENLLDININYYVKVNFTSVIEVVDLLGGITVYNDEGFTSIEGTKFPQGKITLNGNDTLTFVRERKSLSGGDLSRGKNQIKVLEALMNKAMQPSIIKNYNNLLKSLDDAFVTNMNHTTMLGFIKKEIQSPRAWIMESTTLFGTDSYECTYTYKNSKLYVMLPDDDSVKLAKEKILQLQ